jgi:RNA recognition motif-containing protein
VTVQVFSVHPSIYVSQIPSDCSIGDLRSMFERFGTVLDAYFVNSRGSPPVSGSSTTSNPSQASQPGGGMNAIIKFGAWTDAEKAWEEYIDSKELSVRYARPRGGAAEAISAKRLFVGQIPSDVSDVDLRTYFSEYGNLVEVSLLSGKSNSQHGCAFVEYDRWAACDRAIAATHGQCIFSSSDGRSLVVKYAKSKDRMLAHQMYGLGHSAPLQELLMGHSPPTTGYVMCADQMTHSNGLQAYWPPGYLPAVHFEPYVYPQYAQMIPSVPQPYDYVPFPLEDADSRKIFVGQLPRNATEEDVASLFAMFGPVENVTVLRTGARCGFVTFFARHHALIAVSEMHGVTPFADWRPLVVRLASRRGEPEAAEESVHGEH